MLTYCTGPARSSTSVSVVAPGRLGLQDMFLDAVHGRHISHRIPPTDYVRTEKQERRFRREMLQLLHAAHQLCRLPDMQILVEEGGKCADLALTVTTPSLNWQWRAFALHWSRAAQILSKQLIMPTITSMSKLDKTAKTARITSHTHVRAVFSKPVVACGIARVSQIWEHVGDEFLHPTVEDLEELEGAFAPLYFGEPISDDEPELGSERYVQSNTPLRSSPAPLPDANEDGSGTEDEDEDDTGAGETQIQTQLEGSVIGESSARSMLSKNGIQSQISKYGEQRRNTDNRNPALRSILRGLSLIRLGRVRN
ncbi:hypothetical protein BN14_03275 [Rhizoctonia solani AG-1 IB]|uniref:Uncharacterized protein n=1 Tax=Thanatephorus cucumeris (strain AG1-IB / isolate 7/3/14) TaxID=1108050 RepID=M5C034_THACB|nr:hypothetical protein BN14_03275 [Rhizoctonia solani AG-1 IB]